VIVVKIELWSAIDPSRSKEIGRMYIANADTHGDDLTRGDYDVAVCRRGTTRVPAPVAPSGPKATRSGRVVGYPRLAYNVWRLISRALIEAFPEERSQRDSPDVRDSHPVAIDENKGEP
jgi:hypothetical protein